MHEITTQIIQLPKSKVFLLFKYKRQNCQKWSEMANFGTYWVIKRLSYCKILKITSKTLAPHP